MPKRSQLGFTRELRASIPMAVVFGVMGNAFVGLVGYKALGMDKNMVAILQSVNMAGFVATGIGTSHLFKFSKPRILRALFIIVSLLLISIYFTPLSRFPDTLFICQVFLIQTMFAFANSVRSSIWRRNYPDLHRGRLVVAIYLSITSISSLSVMLFSYMMDHGVQFRHIYLGCALAALLTAWGMGQIKVHREKNDLVRYRIDLKSQSNAAQLFSGLKVLKDDPRFSRFMFWQFVNGLSCLSIEAALVLILTGIIENRSDIQNKWLISGTALAALPQIVSAGSSVLWAKYFDSKDIFTVRAIAAGAWSASRLILAFGLATDSISIIMFSRVVTGVSMGLGQIAWRLGHMTFAPPEKDGLYMGTHLMLTGIRGMMAPFVGIFLLKYSWTGPHGIWLIVLSAFGMSLSGAAFLKMKKDYPDLVKK